jgi:AraC-like DNA-binding protein
LIQVQSVGVSFHPTVAQALFGYTAEELAGRHIPLEDLWSRLAVAELREHLHEAPTREAQIDILKRAIAKRLPRLRGIHPAVAAALERFRVTSNIAAVVRDTGYSHRTVAEQFRRTMGIGPKAYLRVARMRRLLGRIGHAPWSDLAADAGFSDQARKPDRSFGSFAALKISDAGTGSGLTEPLGSSRR